MDVLPIPRRRLPDVRRSKTLHFVVHALRARDDGTFVPHDVDGYVQTGEHEDGALGEAFLRIGRPGSEAALYDQWAIAFSIALQRGEDVDVLCDKFLNTRFEPSGSTNLAEIPRCTSVLDLVCRWLKKHYGRASAPSALVVRDGKVLLARRPEGKSFAGMWETPGGKAEIRESDEAAIVRELWEELGVLSSVESLVTEVLLDPPVTSRRYRLPFYLVSIRGEPQALVADEVRWFALGEIGGLKLTPASEEVLVRRPELAVAAGIR